MNEKIMVVEWELEAWEQEEMDWWEANPNATWEEAILAGF